jgi:ribosome-associated protein
MHLRHREGTAGAEWMLLDFGGFIVHVFTERARHFYDLERLWRAARRIDITEPRAPGSAPGAAKAEG